MLMKNHDGDELDPLPRQQLEQVATLCDRFEADWRAGCSSRIEHYLTTALDAERPAVLQTLIGLEVELRRASGEQPTHQEYLERFPGEAHLISSAFSDRTAAGPLPTPRPAPTLPYESAHAPAGAGQDEVRDRYTLVDLHARGGIGEVWLARDHDLGREVALKRLQPAMAVDTSMRGRFLREARVTGQLQHPGIVPVYELCRRPGETDLFYTMRFIKGRTLTEAALEYHRKRKAGRAGSLDLRELLDAFRSVCQVIAYAHNCGVIHRDLKGQNVVLGDYGEVMVLDWGLAKVVGEREAEPGDCERPAGFSPTGDAGESESARTATGMILGTPSYMSPEQAMGRPDLTDQRSDIYGLGAILYEILTGEPPFRGNSHVEVLRRVVEGSPVPPHQKVTNTPLALDAVCTKCMSLAPEGRYAAAEELAKEVECYLAGEPVTAYEEPWAVKARRWAGRHRTLATASAATLLMAMVCLAAATVLLRLSYGRETEARSKAETNFKLAFEAVDRFLTKVGEAPQLKAYGLEKLLQGLLMDAKNFHERLSLEEGVEPRVRAEHGWSCLRLARITEELGEAREAIPLALRARSIFDGLSRLDPKNVEYHEGVARALDSLGAAYQGDTQPAEAKAFFERASEAWERIAREHPGSIEYRYRTAATLNRRGRLLCVVLSDAPGVEEVVGRSLLLCEKLVKDDPKNPIYLNEKAEAMLLLGVSRGDRELARAEELFAEALRLRESLAAANPGALEYQSNLVETCVLIATAYSNARVPGRVSLLHQKVRSIGERLAREHPDLPLFAQNHSLIETLHSMSVAQSGEHARATAAAEQAVSKAPQSGLAKLYAACCYSISSDFARRDSHLPAGERERCAERYQARAMELLREAKTTGVFRQPYQREGIKSTDRDLDPLRTRDDFKKFLAELEDQGPP